MPIGIPGGITNIAANLLYIFCIVTMGLSFACTKCTNFNVKFTKQILWPRSPPDLRILLGIGDDLFSDPCQPYFKSSGVSRISRRLSIPGTNRSRLKQDAEQNSQPTSILVRSDRIRRCRLGLRDPLHRKDKTVDQQHGARCTWAVIDGTRVQLPSARLHNLCRV